MNIQFELKLLTVAISAILLAGCATTATKMEQQPSTMAQMGNPDTLASKIADAGDVTTQIPPDNSLDQPKDIIYRGSDQMVKLPKPTPDQVQKSKDGMVALNFEQVPLTDLVHSILGKLLNVNYSIDAPLTGEVTLHTADPVPSDRLLSILQSYLLANGALMVKGTDGIYHIGPAKNMQGMPAGLVSEQTIPAGYSTVIVPLHYIAAKQMAEILKPLAPPQAFVRVDSARNILMLAGTGAQINDWMSIIHSFDIDMLKGMSVGIFPVEYGSVSEIASAVDALLANGEAAKGSLSGLVKVLPLKRLNSLLIVTPRAHYLDTIKMWIDRLDKPPENSLEPALYVYPVQHGSAAHLAELLNQIYGGGGSGGSSTASADSGVAPGLQTSSISSSGASSGDSGASSIMGNSNNALLGSSSASNGGLGGTNSSGAGGGSGMLTGGAGAASNNASDKGAANVSLKGDSGIEIKVVADNQNNALLIYARRQDYQKIANALRRLDVQPLQVLIEASIIEVSLTGNLQYGLEWYLQGSLGSGLTGSAGLNFNSTGAISPSQPGFSYAITNGEGAVRAVLSALAQKSLVKVISSPSVLVLNNNTANIQVGNQQPIQSAQSIITSGIVSNSITYKDTGVVLSVTPSVNAGGMVRMNIKQAVTDVGAVDSATGQRSFLQRQIDTKVEVHSGQTVTLGGLIKNNVSNGKSGIPYLSDIPVLGNLFSTTTKTDDRTELLVMITPRVLKNPKDLGDITREMRERMSSLESLEQSANYVGIGRSDTKQTSPKLNTDQANP